MAKNRDQWQVVVSIVIALRFHEVWKISGFSCMYFLNVLGSEIA
jgi:hypothetical protein